MLRELAEFALEVGRKDDSDLDEKLIEYVRSIPERSSAETAAIQLLVAGCSLFGDSEPNSDATRAWVAAVSNAQRLLGIVPLVTVPKESK